MSRLLDDDEIGTFLKLLRGGFADWVEDPEAPPSIKSRDPKDDYLSGRSVLDPNAAHHFRP